MLTIISRRLLVLVAYWSISASPATSSGQVCGHWQPEAGPPGVIEQEYSTSPPIQTATAWDPDGDGPYPQVVVVAGDFSYAGNTRAFHTAMWDGDTWQSFPAGSPSIRRLTTFQGDLFAATYRDIYRRNGDSWTLIGEVGTNPYLSRIDLLKVVGDKLYVGGTFSAINGDASGPLVSWNGEQWEDAAAPANATITAVTTDGTVLVIGGKAAGSSAPLVASRPLGASGPWISLNFNLHASASVFDEIHDVTFHNGALYACGRFAAASASIASVVRLDSATWTPLEGASGYADHFLSRHGELLVAGAIGRPIPNSRNVHPGGIMRLGPDDRLHPLGGGISGAVHVALPFRDDLLAFGKFMHAEHRAVQAAARWTGFAWEPLGRGVAHPIASITQWNGRPVVGGGDVVSVQTPEGWQPLGAPFPRVNTSNGPVLAVVAAGQTLYAAGSTCIGPATGNSCPRGVLRWSGASWEPLPGTSVTFSQVNVLHDYHGDLIVAGSFITTTTPPFAGVARWDGAAWHALGSGVVGPVTTDGLAAAPDVRTAVNFAGDLIIAGAFTTADGQPARNIARWDGDEWHAMGAGLPNRADGLTIVGDHLYASVSDTGLMRWNSTTWELIPTNPVNGRHSGPLVTHDGEIVRAGGLYSQTMILRGGDWRSIGHTTGNSPTTVASINGELLIGSGRLASYEDGTRFGYLARWSAGGNVPTRYTLTAPPTISIRRGGNYSRRIIEHSEPRIGVTLAREGVATPTDTTIDGSPWLGYAWEELGDRRVALNIRNAQPAFAGEFRLHLSNDCGVIQTEPFYVTIRCGGDFDGDNAVTIADLFAYLHAYLNFDFDAQHGRFIGGEEISVGDLFAFLNDYLTPCP